MVSSLVFVYVGASARILSPPASWVNLQLIHKRNRWVPTVRPSLYQALGMQPWTSAVRPSQLRGDFLQEAPRPPGLGRGPARAFSPPLTLSPSQSGWCRLKVSVCLWRSGPEVQRACLFSQLDPEPSTSPRAAGLGECRSSPRVEWQLSLRRVRAVCLGPFWRFAGSYSLSPVVAVPFLQTGKPSHCIPVHRPVWPRPHCR